MKSTLKVFSLIMLAGFAVMLAGFAGWHVTAQEPQGNLLSGGQQFNDLQGSPSVPSATPKALTPHQERQHYEFQQLTMVDGVPESQLKKLREKAALAEMRSIEAASVCRDKLQREYPGVDGAALKKAIRVEFRSLVLEAFEARHALQRMEVALLEKKLQAMNRKLEEQETKASEIIERRIDDLLNPNLRWDDSAIKNSTTEGNGPKAAVPNDVKFYAVQDLPLWSKEGTSQHIELLIHYLEARVDSTKNGGDKIGTYDAGRAMLVVRGDARKHEQIAQILTDLRANSGSPAEEDAKDKAYSNSDLRANSAQSDEDLAKENLVKTYSVADLPIWSKDGKKQHVDLLLSYLRLNVDPPSWESKVARAAYNAEMLALVVQGTPEVHNGIKAALSRLRGQTNLYGDPNASTSNVLSSKSNSADPNALERIQEAKDVSPPQLFAAKTPAGVLTYDGNVQEWVGGDRSGTVLPDGAFKPVPNATIHLYRVSPIAKGGSGYQFEEIEVFKSDKQGHFKINIPDNLKRFILTPGTIESDDWESVLQITTSAPGFATDSTTLEANRSLDSIELIRGTSIRGRLVDEHERPIVGAHVTVNAQSRATSREEMDEWLRQTSKEPLPKATFDPSDTAALLAARTRASIANHDVQFIPTQIQGVVTDQEGRFTIDGIGPDDVLDLNVECVGYNNASIKVIGRDIETVYSRDPFASGENIAVHGRTLQATLIASDRGSPHSRHRVIEGERKKGEVEANAAGPSAKEESDAPIRPR